MYNLKDTDIPWIGCIPEKWSVERVKQHFYLKRAKAHQENPIVLSLARGGIRVRDISNNEGQLAESYFDYNPVEPGDLLLNPMDLYSGANCNVSHISGVISPAYSNLKSRGAANPQYYDYYFKTQYLKMALFAHGKGVSKDNRWTLNNNTLLNYFLPVPPREEQDQIVRFLDWKVSGINKLINIRRREIKNLEELKKAIISDAVTKGLDKNVPMKDSGVKWLGEIPKHWTTIKLRQLLHPVSEKNHPELPLLSVVREQGVIIRDVTDKEANHNYIPDDLSGYKVVKKGQFAMNKMKAWQGSYGISDYTGIVSPAYFIFETDFENMEYFHYAIRSKVYVNFFAQASDGIRVGQWDLQMDKMKEIPFIVPPENEQKTIVEYIKRTLRQYDSAIEKLTSEVEILEEYKAKIISDTVTGKIDVRNIDIPEYEYVGEEVDSSEDDIKNEENEEQED